MTGEALLLLAATVAVIAFVYGSVGLGGASSYVAVMSLASIDHREIPLVALGLNLIVGGHSHTMLKEPIRVGDTWIVQAGDHARNLFHERVDRLRVAEGL